MIRSRRFHRAPRKTHNTQVRNFWSLVTNVVPASTTNAAPATFDVVILGLHNLLGSTSERARKACILKHVVYGLSLFVSNPGEGTNAVSIVSDSLYVDRITAATGAPVIGGTAFMMFNELVAGTGPEAAWPHRTLFRRSSFIPIGFQGTVAGSGTSGITGDMRTNLPVVAVRGKANMDDDMALVSHLECTNSLITSINLSTLIHCAVAYEIRG